MAEIQKRIQKPTKGYFLSENDVKRAEQHYQSKFVDTFELGRIVDVFYNPNPDVAKGHSHYFGLHINPINGLLYVSNAEGVLKQHISGLVSDDGEVVFSRHRHDYRVSEDGSVSIDGGRDYLRVSILDSSNGSTITERLVRLKIVEDRLVEDVS